MSPTPIRSHIPQSLDVFHKLPPEIIFDLHRRQFSGYIEHCLVGEGTQAGGRMDVEAGEEARGDLRTDAIEVLDCFL